MRNRVEDLGRLMERLSKLMESTDHYSNYKYWNRPKDANDFFFSQARNTQSEIIHDLAYQLEAISQEISECWSIAAGQDWLNEDKKDES